MTPIRRLRRLSAFVASVIAAAGCTSVPLSARRPTIAPSPSPQLPDTQPSMIALPIRMALDTAALLIDGAIPASYDSKPECAVLGLVCGTASIDLEPVLMRFDDDRISARSLISYQIDGYFFGLRLASCGHPDERKRQALATASTRFRLDTSWTMQVFDATAHIDAIDLCRVAAANIDVTGKAIDLMNRAGQRLPGRLQDAVMAHGSFRRWADTAWTFLRTPIRLDDATWLSLNPEAIVAAPLTAGSEVLSARLGVRLRPVFTRGSQPATSNTPLPSLTLAEPGDSIVVEPNVVLSFRELNARFGRALIGKRVVHHVRFLPDPWVEVDSTLLYAAGTNVVVGVHVKGSLRGTLYLVGRVGYDCMTDKVRIDWVDYDIDTRNVLVRFARWVVPGLLDAEMRRQLTSITWDAGTHFRDMESALTRTLNRDVGPHARISGTVTRVGFIGYEASDTAFALRFRLMARASLEVVPGDGPLPTGSEIRAVNITFLTQNDDKDSEESVQVWITRNGTVLAYREFGGGLDWNDHETTGPYTFRLRAGLTRQNCSGLRVRIKKTPVGSDDGKGWHVSLLGDIVVASGEVIRTLQTQPLEVGDGHPYDREFVLC